MNETREPQATERPSVPPLPPDSPLLSPCSICGRVDPDGNFLLPDGAQCSDCYLGLAEESDDE